MWTKFSQKHLVDTAILHMPQLQALGINYADLECFRDSECGNGSIYYFHGTQQRVVKAVKAYIAPAFVQKLPLLTVPRRGSFTESGVFVLKGERMRGIDSRLTYTLEEGV